jgi:AhpD family alkylhydroperoxidase
MHRRRQSSVASRLFLPIVFDGEETRNLIIRLNPFRHLLPLRSWTFHEGGDGAIPRKYRELIVLGVAFTTQCGYCIDTHTRQARDAGASKEEIAETAFVAAAVRAGGTLAHALLSLRVAEGR